MSRSEKVVRRPCCARRCTHANCGLLANAEGSFRNALRNAAIEGFYGEVRVSVTFQDGVAQKINVENSRTIR